MNAEDRFLEDQMLGWMIESPAQLHRVFPHLVPDDFYYPKNRDLFDSILDKWSTGEPSGIGSLIGEFPGDFLIERTGMDFNPNPEEAARKLASLTLHRKLVATLSSGLGDADVLDPNDVAGTVIESLTAAVSRTAVEPEAVSWGDVLKWDATAMPWVIPGMLRRQHRAIFVGGEGSGKTVLLRQIAIAASCGLHPFTHTPLAGGRVRTLVVDLENPKDQVQEVAARLATSVATKQVDLATVEEAAVVCWPGGLDIRNRRDRLRLQAEIQAHQPELVCIGPMYKLFAKRPGESDEEAAMDTGRILDELRVRFDTAMVFEHHAPHASGGAKRSLRPVGSSFWLRWPEFGFGMRPENTNGRSKVFELEQFRGPRLTEATWPDKLEWSTTWPWVATYPTGTFRRTDDDF